MAFNTTPNLFFNSNLCFDMHKRFVMTVLTVKISDDDSTLIQKHLMYEQTVCLNHEDPTLILLVNEAQKSFGKDAKDILINIKYTW